jgi:hypothetical protein
MAVSVVRGDVVLIHALVMAPVKDIHLDDESAYRTCHANESDNYLVANRLAERLSYKCLALATTAPWWRRCVRDTPRVMAEPTFHPLTTPV